MKKPRNTENMKKLRNKFGWNNNRIVKRKRKRERDWNRLKSQKSKRKTLSAKESLEDKGGDKI